MIALHKNNSDHDDDVLCVLCRDTAAILQLFHTGNNVFLNLNWILCTTYLKRLQVNHGHTTVAESEHKHSVMRGCKQHARRECPFL